MRKTILSLVPVALAALILAAAAQAQPISIDIFGPGQSKMNLSLTRPLGVDGSTPPDAQALQEAINRNLTFLPFFNLVPASSVLGGDSPGGVKADQIDFSRYKKSQVDILVTSGWSPSGGNLGTVELRAFSSYNGSLVVGKAYASVTKDQIPSIANRFCSALMEALTGRAGFFDSTIAFVKKNGANKEIWAVSPQGSGLRQITKLRGLSVSPAWSRDGRYIAFTHIGPTEHTLGVYDSSSNTTRTIKLPGNSVISPCYFPDGRIAVAIDNAGNSDIVVLGSNYQVQSRLAQSWAIDVSPSIDEAGKRMVFVSNRLGNPHIFLLDLGSGETRRLSTEGKYNTNPCISPDGKLVVYSREYPGGHRIILHDLTNGTEKQITNGPGSDEKPTFSPDGYFIAYSSSRAGGHKLYLTTRHGDPAVLIPTGDGDATSPAWSARSSDSR